MNRELFEEMTGFKPTDDEWAEIWKQYENGMLSPDEYCEKFVKEGRAAALTMERGRYIEELKSQIVDQRRYYEGLLDAKTAEAAEAMAEAAEAMAKLSGKVAALQESLDRELDWKKAQGVGTRMDQDEYEDLAKHGVVMWDELAKQRVCREFGFDIDRVEIKRCAEVFERNKYGELRVREINVRPPVYEAEGKDYVRFDCAGYQYEMVNGELMRYED